MITSSEYDREEFLKEFFGEGNMIRLKHIEDPTRPRQARFLPWVERMRGENPQETILPWINKNTKKVIWFGLAFSEGQASRLSEILHSFIGPSYSTYTGRRSQLNLDQPIEKAVSTITGGRVFRFEGDDEVIWSQLELVGQVLQAMPERKKGIDRPVGRILRDFYMSLQAGNRIQAEHELANLKDRYDWTASNELFLQVQFLHAFKEWNSLVHLMEKSELLRMRRPSEVTGALIEAVYHVELASFEQEGENRAKQAAEHFSTHVWPRFASLFGVRGHLKSPEVMKSFLLRAVAVQPYQPNVCSELLNLQLSGHDRAYLREITEMLPHERGETSESLNGLGLEKARESMQQGFFDQAFASLNKLPASLERTLYLFECAYELDEMEAKRVALDAYEKMSDLDRQIFQRSRRNREYLQQIQVGEGVSFPRNWIEWIEQIQHRGSVASQMLAKQGATEWKVEDMFQNDDDLQRFRQALRRCYDHKTQKEALQNAFPHLLDSFRQDPEWPRREYRQVYLEFLQILAFTSNLGENDLTIFNVLSEALLFNGLNYAEYQSVVDYAKLMWDQGNGSVVVLDWALELGEILSLSVCPAPEERLSFIVLIVESLPRLRLRLTSEHWRTLQLLHDDLGLNEMWENFSRQIPKRDGESDVPEESEIPWHLLRDKQVGIYSLNDRVAERVKVLLTTKEQNVKVLFSNAKVAKDELQYLAKNSDILLIAWACAKHAATIYLKEQRLTSGQTLYPKGSGSSSIMRELQEYLKTI